MLKQQHTVVVAKDRFACWTGDAVEVFKCWSVIITIRTAENCYKDIPVDGLKSVIIY